MPFLLFADVIAVLQPGLLRRLQKLQAGVARWPPLCEKQLKRGNYGRPKSAPGPPASGSNIGPNCAPTLMSCASRHVLMSCHYVTELSTITTPSYSVVSDHLGYGTGERRASGSGP
jgi:hypothetical protein